MTCSNFNDPDSITTAILKMIVLNRNLFEIDPNSIVDSKVVYTIFAGKIVYDAQMPDFVLPFSQPSRGK